MWVEEDFYLFSLGLRTRDEGRKRSETTNTKMKPEKMLMSMIRCANIFIYDNSIAAWTGARKARERNENADGNH